MSDLLTTTLTFTFEPSHRIKVEGQGFGPEGITYSYPDQADAFIESTQWVVQLNLARHWGSLNEYMQEVEPEPIPDIIALAGAYLKHFVELAHRDNKEITLIV